MITLISVGFQIPWCDNLFTDCTATESEGMSGTEVLNLITIFYCFLCFLYLIIKQTNYKYIIYYYLLAVYERKNRESRFRKLFSWPYVLVFLIFFFIF